ncbi:DUF6082 family protein [Streptomyces sp. NPDC096310]|uniref:DUF6082 family protein n=1 Tax=Streptomyces sp. NPDC096310 TaxID=3366082 RepID=UPI00382E0A35
MKSPLLTAAALTAAAAGVVRLYQERAQHRDRMRLCTVKMHHRMMRDEFAPDIAELFPFLNSLEEGARRRFLHCNSRVTFWALQLRLGLVSESGLSRVAWDFMTSPHAPFYWERSAFAHRWEASGKVLDLVNILDDAYNEAIRDARDLSESGDLVGAGA